ncbi:MAG: DUF2279 domain-containing protein [Chitinophagaceae bacterium]
MKKKLFIFLVSPIFSILLFAQDSVVYYRFYKPDSVTLQKRQLTAAGVTLGSYSGTLILLNSAWYNNYKKTSFHVFNDAKEWQQMDKLGHVWSAYHISRATSAMWQWAGLSRKRSVVAGSLSSLGFMTAIEFLDAYSSKWGWSWTDVSTNFFGTSLFAAQDFVWEDQKVLLKFSSFPIAYNASLKPRADELYGNNFQSRLLKDYNGQTYWLSFNLKSFLPNQNFPAWINIAVGHGANGMFGGFENIAYDENGAVSFYRPDIKRYRQWYLSPDVDWTRIKTNKKGLGTFFSLLNAIKIPAPALEYSNGKLHGRLIAF